MFVISNFLVAVAKILNIALSFYMFVLIGRVIVSWIYPDPYNPVVKFLTGMTEPVLSPIRRKIPINLGGIDFSPVLVILAIIFLQSFLVKTLHQLAATFG